VGIGIAAEMAGVNGALIGFATAKVAIPKTKAEAIRRRFFIEILPAQRRHRRIMNLFL
jgi:hypothetical protein